jgi:hypothetical protein
LACEGGPLFLFLSKESIMSFLNGAELCLNFKPATTEWKRKWAHAQRMTAKAQRSPSRVFVAKTLAQWGRASGYPEGANVYPAWYPTEGNFTAQVDACKSWLSQQ